MKTKTILVPITLLLIFRSASVLAGPFETFTGFTAQNPGAVVAGIDEFFASDDSQGYEVILVETMFAGDSPVTHFIVAEYDDYAAYEALTNKRADSLAWHRVVQSVLAAATPVAEGMGIMVADYGEGWPEQDYVVVIDLSVTDAQRYLKAFEKLLKTDASQKAPGITRLMALRGAGATEASHYVVMSGPTFAALNDYLDMLFSSDDYADFVDDVADIRSIVGTSIYKKVKAWSK